MAGYTGSGFSSAIPLPEPCPGEFCLQRFDDFGGYWGGATAPALHATQIIIVDDGIADYADEDGRHEDEFRDLVLLNGREHGGKGVAR